MIGLRAGWLGALLAFTLMSAIAGVALAGKTNRNNADALTELLSSITRSLQDLQKHEQRPEEMLLLKMMMQQMAGKDVDWGAEILAIRRKLEETKAIVLNPREGISGGQRERFFPDVRHRLAVFTFDDPHATGLGDPISFLLSKKLLFSSRVTSFAIVNYRQGADRDSSSDLAYFDRVDAVTKDQNFPLAIWGRLSRTDRGVRIDSFLQIPGDAEKSPYERTIQLPAAMGGGTLTARLKPDRLLMQSLYVDYDKTSLLKTAA